MNIEVIGIDHIYVSVTDLERSESFYDRIMPVLGFLRHQSSVTPEVIISLGEPEKRESLVLAGADRI